MKSRPVLVLLAMLLAMFAAPAAFAQPTEIRVDRGTAAPLPIAAPAFTGAGPHGVELAETTPLTRYWAAIARQFAKAGVAAPSAG